MSIYPYFGFSTNEFDLWLLGTETHWVIHDADKHFARNICDSYVIWQLEYSAVVELDSPGRDVTIRRLDSGLASRADRLPPLLLAERPLEHRKGLREWACG